MMLEALLWDYVDNVNRERIHPRRCAARSSGSPTAIPAGLAISPIFVGLSFSRTADRVAAAKAKP
jgi:hypothetical protein